MSPERTGAGLTKNRERQLPGATHTRQLTLAVLFLFAVCCFASDAVPMRERFAERLGVSARARVEPSVVPITGVVTLLFSVEGAAPLTVEPLKLGDLPGWRIRSAGEPTTTPLSAGRERRDQVFRLVPDRAGELALPLPAIRVRPGGRESWVELAFEPLGVRVTTSLPRVDLDEAREVTGPEAAPPAPPARLGVWLTGVGVVAGALLLWSRWRTRRRRDRRPEPTLAAWLDGELARLGPVDAAAPSAADSLGDVIRGYLARRYRVVATGRTTGELVSLLPAEAAADWRDVLERCDLAKFARAGFTPAEWDKALVRLRDARATLPAGEPPPSADTTAVGQIT